MVQNEASQNKTFKIYVHSHEQIKISIEIQISQFDKIFLLEEVVTSTISFNKFQFQLLLRSNFSQELNDVTQPLLIVENCGVVSSCLHLSFPTCLQ